MNSHVSPGSASVSDASPLLWCQHLEAEQEDLVPVLITQTDQAGPGREGKEEQQLEHQLSC